ncbi:hypothetical protein O5O45_11675 [Hahella aquimaris]|uniref:hypothetical protein n=1 Tax=Hahella sp. HNIBRBA332 TaxID=3015983 RepID=UPI00273B013C|nr:hypothetical protein [Hahella sp. HNIBRBA332]WLQ16580.1 hypothetical protein O5O45_11675 [Hahella sp. HNIBRBA332]
MYINYSTLTAGIQESSADMIHTQQNASRLGAILDISIGRIVEDSGKRHEFSIAKKAVEVRRWYDVASRNSDVTQMQRFVEQRLQEDNSPKDSLFKKWATQYFQLNQAL